MFHGKTYNPSPYTIVNLEIISHTFQEFSSELQRGFWQLLETNMTMISRFYRPKAAKSHVCFKGIFTCEYFTFGLFQGILTM